MLSVVTTVFFSALQLRNRTAQTFDQILPLQHAIAVLKRDLAATLPPGGTLVGEFQTTPSADASSALNLFANGQQVSPLIYTASGMIDESTPFADVQKVAYYLIEPTNSITPGRDLVRIVSRNLLPTTTEVATSQWLMGGIEQMNFQYFDGTSWTATWDSTTSSNLPSAIKIQIALATEANQENSYIQSPIEMVVPVVAQARTARAQPSGGGP